jgi:hypothetical protein
MIARSERKRTHKLVEAIRSCEPVTGYTHTFYRYPARFSPLFAREVIERFTLPGDVVLDPFMGGGTTLVEARTLGRRGVGSDVSSLAVFLAKTKTTLLTDSDSRELVRWANSSSLEHLNLRKTAIRDEEWIEDGYLRNISGRPMWAIRKIVELALGTVEDLRGERQRMFARCAILRTAQWALDCRSEVPSANQFRTQFLIFINEMILGANEFSRACRRWGSDSDIEPLCLHQSALTLSSTYSGVGLPSPRLVLTSPPYPGVHVLYHRWQIMGRRETPAPFWIAGTKDGAGASFYTFGDRHRPGLSNYFETALDSFKSVASIADKRTVVIQQLAFSERRTQLARYLRMMEDAGFQEMRREVSNAFPGRIWRSVPNRKWYATKQGNTASSSEVVLFHKLA